MSTTVHAPAQHQPPASARRRHVADLVASAALFLPAVVMLAAGVGLAVPHVRKEGSVPATWLGFALLAVGFTGAAWSAWRMLRRLRLRWWLLALPAILVTTCLALWTVGQAVAASLPARPELGSRTPADLGLRYDDVTVTTPDGTKLAAWWVPTDNGAAVALLHGAGSTRTAVLTHAAVLAEHGYGVLVLDARGHGESDGRGMDFGWYGEPDLAAAVDLMTGELGIDRVGLVGLSMGGEEAIGAAGVDSRVRAVVAEGATHRVAGDKAYLAEHYGMRGSIQQGIDRLTYTLAGLLTDAPEPPPLRESVVDAQGDGVPTPVLLITAEQVQTEGLAATYLEQAAPRAVDVWTVPDTGHISALRTHPEAWEQRVVGFLDAALQGPRPTRDARSRHQDSRSTRPS